MSCRWMVRHIWAGARWPCLRTKAGISARHAWRAQSPSRGPCFLEVIACLFAQSRFPVLRGMIPKACARACISTLCALVNTASSLVAGCIPGKSGRFIGQKRSQMGEAHVHSSCHGKPQGTAYPGRGRACTCTGHSAFKTRQNWTRSCCSMISATISPNISCAGFPGIRIAGLKP
jgi:hypothetical protein